MNANGFFNWLAGITTVALVTTLVSHPYTASIIRESSGLIGNSYRAAMGK